MFKAFENSAGSSEMQHKTVLCHATAACPHLQGFMSWFALQFAQLAKKIAELEAAEAQRCLQLQPILGGTYLSQPRPPLMQQGIMTADGVRRCRLGLHLLVRRHYLNNALCT